MPCGKPARSQGPPRVCPPKVAVVEGFVVDAPLGP